MTATTTRRKQQQQMIHRALLAEEDRRRAARENFHMTSVAVTQHASYEPALLHSPEDHEDGKIYCAGQRGWLLRLDKSISTHNFVLHCTLTACVSMASQLLHCNCRKIFFCLQQDVCTVLRGRCAVLCFVQCFSRMSWQYIDVSWW